MQGLLEPKADLNDIQASCSTSNCTFPSYSTIGVCHSIVDYTSHVLKDCYNMERLDGSKGPLDCTYNINDLSIEMDNNSFPLERKNVSFSHSIYKDVMVDTPSYGGDDAGVAIQYYFDPDGGNIVTFFVIYQDQSAIHTIDSRDTVRALKGPFRFCVYTVNTVVLNGKTSTQFEQVYKDVHWQKFSQSTAKKKIPRPIYYTAALEEEGYPKQTFTVDHLSKWSLNQYLSKLVFKGNWAGNNIFYRTEDSTSDTARAMGRAMYHPQVNGELVLQSLEGLERMLNNTTTRLTNA